MDEKTTADRLADAIERYFDGDAGRGVGEAVAAVILADFDVTAKPDYTPDWGCGTCGRCVGAEADRQYERNMWPQVGMILCVTCGNKRCPKATDHDLECTGSNEPGQPGSVYGMPRAR